MTYIKHISRLVSVFHGREAPESGLLVGYGALIEFFQLKMPLPAKLTLISEMKRQYKTNDWIVLTPRHRPNDTLYKQLVFALKYEGLNLLFFKKLFDVIEPNEIIDLVNIEPLGQYSRRIWFIYEWLFQAQLNVPDLATGNFVPLLDEKLQYVIPGTRSSRHRIINNLPGTPGFCPLISKTSKLDKYILSGLSDQKNQYLDNVHADILQRTSAFLLLKDSRASFTIEGEIPINRRLQGWAQVVGSAGMKDITKNELLRLQELVITDHRFVEMGLRKKGGFVGDHNRETGEPLPDHISARWQDLDKLIDGWIESNQLLEKADMDAVLVASLIAFGFVFIHPYEDGNGRIHRYLIHHILSRKGFARQGMIFPVSASILKKITDYRRVLESYSHPVLEFVEWKEAADHNIEVLSESIDFYRYFDATKQAEFLYECVEDTIQNIIPEEITYLQKYDAFKQKVDSYLDLPDKLISLMVRFLEQGGGKLSKRAQEKEFKALTQKEINHLQSSYQEIFFSV